MQHTVPDFFKGLQAYWLGVGWLKKNKRYFSLLLFPMFAGFIMFFGTLIGGYLWIKPYVWELLVMHILPPTVDSESYWPLKLLLSIGLVGALFFIALFASQIMVSIIAAPLYEIVSCAVEKSITGDAKVPQVGFWHSLLLIKEEIKKALVIFLLPTLISLIPVLNICAPLVAAFCLGWDFYDYPMARRGWSFSRRFDFVRKEFFVLLGFGVWLMIPVVSVPLMSLAVAGGTLLNVEALRKKGLLSPEKATALT